MTFRVSSLLALAGLVDPWWYTPESRERGHTVHAIGEAVLTGQPVEVAQAYLGYAKALRAGVEALGLQTICAERRLQRGKITGRPDVIGWLPRGVGSIRRGPAIVDIKSGDRMSCHAIQLGFYEWLADGTPDLRAALPDGYQDFPWNRVGLYVKENGSYKLHPYEDPHDRLVCSAITDLVEWRIAHGLLKPTDAAAQEDDPVFTSH